MAHLCHFSKVVWHICFAGLHWWGVIRTTAKNNALPTLHSRPAVTGHNPAPYALEQASWRTPASIAAQEKENDMETKNQTVNEAEQAEALFLKIESKQKAQCFDCGRWLKIYGVQKVFSCNLFENDTVLGLPPLPDGLSWQPTYRRCGMEHEPRPASVGFAAPMVPNS